MTIKDELFSNPKMVEIKNLFAKMSSLSEKTGEEFKSLDSTEKEEMSNTQILYKIIRDLDLSNAFNYIFVSKALIIDKMAEIIQVINTKKDVTYEEITKLLQEVLRAKSNIEECGKIKARIKDKVLIKIVI